MYAEDHENDRVCDECGGVFYICDQRLPAVSEDGFILCEEHQELNPGRDLRAEAKEVVLRTVEDASGAETPRAGIKIILAEIEPWVGGTDKLFALMGRTIPKRPPEVFEGVSDALLELDPADMDAHFVIALLTLTCQLKEQTAPGRIRFARLAREHYEKTRPNDVEGLLGGLA